ncbi:hypothetical protein NQT66_10360 [Cellulophaga baltica]|uniref:hypothetical protein n=1 Tax=Cellulophaga baltica TaxID=76594 RepID=UPI002147C191|nr:hypothetical protein [Cellulophaga baltica]MCR1025209.1 hypothetical protein [Cellulophaga baltica]
MKFEVSFNEIFFSMKKSRQDFSLLHVSNTNLNVIIEGLKIFNFNYVDKMFWLVTSGKSITLNEFGKELAEHNCILFLESINNFHFLSNYIVDDERYLSVYDYKLSKVIFQMDFSSTIFLLEKENLFVLKFGENLEKKEIYSYSISDSQGFKWHFSLLSLPPIPKTDVYNKDADWEVKKFIGVLDNKLWIALNHHSIIALDIATGQLKQKISSIPDFNSEWLPAAIPLPESIIITAESNKLFGFMWEFYWEINPKNGLIEFTDLTNYLKEYNIRNDNTNYVLVGDIIYFISQHVSAVGGFNRKTKKLNWHFKFQANKDGQFPKLKEIKGNEQMLGVLDLDENLYVFENNKPAITHSLRA